MKDLATNTRDKPSQIFAQVASQCDDNVQALLPREENPKRTIRYQRPTPPVPATYDIELSVLGCTASDYPLVSSNFFPLCCLSFDLRLLITFWYLVAIELSVLGCTASD